MKKSFLKSLCVLSVAACWNMGCTPSCGDPALVAIPAADATAPTGKWMVSVLTITPSGPISSMTPYEDPSNTLTVKTTDEVTVQWVASDEESGIKTTSMEGSWVQACNTSSGPISATALVPKVEQDLSFLTVCALKSWSLPRTEINVNFPCPPPGTLTDASYTFTGKASNMKGGGAMSVLKINITAP
ncbi:MAG: hypothetical protein IPH16_15450 [Haliscomenobacter sp.]|nr:hypothetical protein [Haliscomenobacter sp.]MBK7478110.1 hypothetical protein [Haliscomenobacter sp.]MBK8877820.1 hypothetical protein [Haliscomenobacter sp.]